MPESVLVTGLVVGVFCVGTVCFVFARRGMFGLGGAVLCFTGLLLIGLSVWKNAAVQVGDNGVTVKVTALEESVQNLKDASAALNTQVEDLARERPVYNPVAFRKIDSSLATSAEALLRAKRSAPQAP